MLHRRFGHDFPGFATFIIGAFSFMFSKSTLRPSSADRYAAQTISIVFKLSEARVSCGRPVTRPSMKWRWVVM